MNIQLGPYTPALTSRPRCFVTSVNIRQAMALPHSVQIKGQTDDHYHYRQA